MAPTGAILAELTRNPPRLWKIQASRIPMNVLIAADPGSTALFIITVQQAGRPTARFAGRRRIMVPLHCLQSMHRRLLLAGDTILSVTPYRTMGDPPPHPHPVAGTVPHGPPASEAASGASVGEPLLLPASQAEGNVSSPPTKRSPEQARQGQRQNETFVVEAAMVLLLSMLGVLVLVALQVLQSMARQWWSRTQAQQRPDPPAVDVRKRGLANC